MVSTVYLVGNIFPSRRDIYSSNGMQKRIKHPVPYPFPSLQGTLEKSNYALEDRVLQP
jgi:hypothetical protein